MEQLFGTGFSSKSPNVTAQRRVNCYYEFIPDSDKTSVAIYGTPGIDLFADFGDTPIRGMWSPTWDSYFYLVHRGTFWQVDNAGVKTSRGTINTTTGRVSISDNGTQIIIVDGTDGWIYNTSTFAFTQITDVDFPANPNTVSFDSGRFLVDDNNTGRIYGSLAYNGLSWEGLEFFTAESIPDQVIRVESVKGYIVPFGEFSIEFWQNAGLPGFPYTRVGGANQDFGLAARWSVVNYLGTLAFLAKTKNGEVNVSILSGYTVERISDFELENTINGFASVADAVFYSYMLRGHPMLVIIFPSAGYSFLYDASTKVWSDLKSKDLNRHRGDIHVNFKNKSYLSDFSNGKLYRINPDTYTDNGEEIRMELISRHLYKEGRLIRISSFQVDGQMGVGLVSGQGSNPQMMLSVSKDGGHSFSNERWVTIGAIGNYTTRARWRQIGSARDFVFKIVITDPVKRVITRVYLDER